MSCFISIVAPEAACLLTDAAVWGDDDILVDITSKVWKSSREPIAVTTRGNFDAGRIIAERICSNADELGAASAIESLQELVDDIHASFGDRFDGQGDGRDVVHVLISAFVPGVGGTHRFFGTEPKASRMMGSAVRTQAEAWRVYEPQGDMFGDFLSPGQMQAAGIPFLYPSETVPQWVRKTGGVVMDELRKQKRPTAGGKPSYFVGGRAELTVLTAAGAKTETLRTWPDRIGEPIDPFRAPINRKQRRALAAG
jgi:hypothetical protein